MNAKRYPEEFRIEAVKQILEHGHSVADVSRRIGVSTHSLYKWIKLQQMPTAQRHAQVGQSICYQPFVAVGRCIGHMLNALQSAVAVMRPTLVACG